MAKTSPLSAIQQLDARIEEQLTHFMPMEDEEEYEAPEKKGGKAKLAVSGALAGATGAAALKERAKGQFKNAGKIMDIQNRTPGVKRVPVADGGWVDGIKKPGALYRGADKAMTKTAGGLRKVAGGISKLRGRLHGLEAAVDAQLKQFGLDPDDYVGARTSRKKKKRAVAGGVLAAGAVAGGVAAAGKGAMVKRGAMNAGAAVANKAGDAMLGGMKAAEKRGFKKTGRVLGKGAGKAWKGASKLMLHRVDTVARGLVEFGAR